MIAASAKKASVGARVRKGDTSTFSTQMPLVPLATSSDKLLANAVELSSIPS